jgi:Kef-type K+ transport system membrane component KefB
MVSVLGVLTVAFVAGRLGAEAAERLRQPAVIGEIVAGILGGPRFWAGFRQSRKHRRPFRFSRPSRSSE